MRQLYDYSWPGNVRELENSTGAWLYVSPTARILKSIRLNALQTPFSLLWHAGRSIRKGWQDYKQ